MTENRNLFKAGDMIYQSGIDTREALSELAKRKILFGHQSVGYNIIKGLEVVSDQQNVPLNIIETRDLKNLPVGYLAHTRIGENKNPLLKIEDFQSLIDDASADSPDIAFFKFCYIDIRRDDDIQKIFQGFKSSLDSLQEKYPEILFIVFTVPLRTLQRGPKAWIKKILGKPVGELRNNIARNEFNELLVNNLAEEYPVFDLARVESTLPGGKPTLFEYQGKQYYSLCRKYTKDGGHLNNYGMQWVASNLLFFLADHTDSK